MTDSEIVKALECCKNDGIICGECPYKKVNGCMEKMSADALDLINRLQKELDIMSEEHLDILERLETAKAEAYKEFAERLANKAMLPQETNDDYAVGLTTINKTLKELIGE